MNHNAKNGATSLLAKSKVRIAHKPQGGFKNLQNRSRRRQSAHFSSIIGVLAPTAVGGYDFLKPPCISRWKGLRTRCPPDFNRIPI